PPVDGDRPFGPRIEAALQRRAKHRNGGCITRFSQGGDRRLAVRLAASGDLVERARVETDREHDRRDQACRHSWNWMPSCTPVVLDPAGGLMFCTASPTRALCPSWLVFRPASTVRAGSPPNAATAFC